MSEMARAQRWHDTDHGRDRGWPLRSNRFRRALPDPAPSYVSACWCCCEVCNPGWNPDGRVNPWWSRAKAEMVA